MAAPSAAPAPSAAATAAGFTPYVPSGATNSAPATPTAPMNASSLAPSQAATSAGFTPYSPTATPAPAPVAEMTPTPSAQPSISDLGGTIMKALGDWFHQSAAQAQGGIAQVKSGLSGIFNDANVSAPDVAAADAGGGPGAAIAQGGAEALQGGANAVSDLGKAVGGVGAAVTSPLAPLFNAGTAIGNSIGDALPTSIDKGVADVANNPIVAQNAPKILNESNLALPDVAEPAASAVSSAVDTAKSGIDAIKANAAPLSDFGSLPDKNAAQINTLAEEWTRPTTINKNTYNGARNVLENSPSAPRFLAELGANPAGHVEDGNYATTATADSLRATAAKLSSDTIRPSLQAADYSVPKTPVSDITAATIKQIQDSKGVTPGDKQAQIAKAKTEGAALEAQYPDGMSLTDMHDNKITYASNGKYSPVGDTNVNNTAGVNRAFGRALASTVETKAAPLGIPVKETNAYFQKYYQAADYLDALNGKKAPVSMLKSAVRKTAAFVGAGAGEMLGGGVVSAFAGYSIGKALEHLVEHMSENSKDAFIRNIKITNPPAFDAIKNYLGQTRVNQATMPRLNAPSPLGSPENPIIPPAPTTFEPAAQQINREPVTPLLQLNKQNTINL